MPKLAKNYYRTAKGDKRINCYMVNIPKEVVKKSDIEDTDEIAIYEELGAIIIKKKYHCTCMECGYEWDSGEEYNIQTACPRCKVGDIHYDRNGEI